MEVKNKKLIIIVSIIVIISVILASFYYANNFNVTYEIETNYIHVWGPNYIINNTEPIDPSETEVDIEVTLFIESWEEWNSSFIKNAYSDSDWTPDFNNYSYAFIDWGHKGTLGYEIAFEKISYKKGIIEFHYSKYKPEAGGAQPDRPMELVRIDKTQFFNHPIENYEFILDSST